MILQFHWTKSRQNRHDNNTLGNSRTAVTQDQPKRCCPPRINPHPRPLTCAWYKSRHHPPFASSIFLSFLIHPSLIHAQHLLIHQLHLTFSTLNSSQLPQSSIPKQWLPKRLPRNPPLAARPQLEKLPQLRRRRLARRPRPLPLARRRSEARPGRRPTPLTSTRVRSVLDLSLLHPILTRLLNLSPQASAP